MDNTIQRLDQMKMFDVMSDEELVWWAGRFQREHYRRGDVIIHQGEPSRTYYIVDQGVLRAREFVEDEAVPRAFYYEGDFFGAVGLLTDEPQHFTIDVLADAELLVLGASDFDQLVQVYPEIRETLRILGSQREQAGRLRFPWQEPDEVTIYFSTRHWVVLVRDLLWVLLIVVLALGATAIYLGTDLGDLIAIILMIIAGSLWAFAVLMALYFYYDWLNDHYVITNLRVLHVERVLGLREDRDEAPVDRIQDVQIRQAGVLANLLDYGDVVIQTAAATQKIVYTYVPRPDLVQNILFGPLRHAPSEEQAAARAAIRQELGQRLNIPVTPLDGQPESDESVGLTSPVDETAAETEEDAFAPLDWVRAFWDWLRGVFTFDTWIVSDGGNTVTWRKNGWLLVRESLAPFFSAFFVSVLFLYFLSQGIGFPVAPLILLFVLAGIFGWWFYRYWDWQNDIYQISGNRLIDLKKRPLWLEELRRETTLDRIQNVGLSMPGILAQLLNFGNLIIETAGETGAFEFENVHDPRAVQAEIFSRRERVAHQQRQEESVSRRAELGDWFEVYDELKQEP